MKNLAIKAVVTSREGFYYRQENEWRNLKPQAVTIFASKLAEMADYAIKAGKNHSPGSRQVVLECWVDGVEQSPIVVTGISEQEQKKFQRMAAKFGDELLSY